MSFLVYLLIFYAWLSTDDVFTRELFNFLSPTLCKNQYLSRLSTPTNENSLFCWLRLQIIWPQLRFHSVYVHWLLWSRHYCKQEKTYKAVKNILLLQYVVLNSWKNSLRFKSTRPPSQTPGWGPAQDIPWIRLLLVFTPYECWNRFFLIYSLRGMHGFVDNKLVFSNLSIKLGRQTECFVSKFPVLQV